VCHILIPQIFRSGDKPIFWPRLFACSPPHPPLLDTGASSHGPSFCRFAISKFPRRFRASFPLPLLSPSSFHFFDGNGFPPPGLLAPVPISFFRVCFFGMSPFLPFPPCQSHQIARRLFFFFSHTPWHGLFYLRPRPPSVRVSFVIPFCKRFFVPAFPLPSCSDPCPHVFLTDLFLSVASRMPGSFLSLGPFFEVPLSRFASPIMEDEFFLLGGLAPFPGPAEQTLQRRFAPGEIGTGERMDYVQRIVTF